MQIAHVNDSSNPTVIDSELFVGRVLIKIRDFEGITPDGSNPIRDHVYFDGRSRKFDIQIEGKFKRRPGVPLYSGEEVHFGSRFSKERLQRWNEGGKVDRPKHFLRVEPSKRPSLHYEPLPGMHEHTLRLAITRSSE
ncbi:hypothetical protein BY996DRAFT_2516161 [Phakopsora pachyrhizi]|nr:hypothetical protein BY996DRAFT_2516161 [Phakopsora pachyrhizi]